MEATRQTALAAWLVADVVTTVGAFRVLRGRQRLFLLGPLVVASISVTNWWLNRNALSGFTRAAANIWLWFGLSSCAWISSLLWLFRIVVLRRNDWRVQGLVAFSVLAVATSMDLQWGFGSLSKKGYASWVGYQVLIVGGASLITGLLAPPPDPTLD